jgi:hypothetical protein
MRVPSLRNSVQERGGKRIAGPHRIHHLNLVSGRFRSARGGTNSEIGYRCSAGPACMGVAFTASNRLEGALEKP